MAALDPDLAGSVAAAALAAFAALPKSGKPQAFEHTALAAIALSLPPAVADRLGAAGPVVVAMGTGTKSLPGAKRAPDGSAVNDCHAEALVRRAFLKWAYEEAHSAAQRGTPSLVFALEEIGGQTAGVPAAAAPKPRRVRLAPGVSLHMFVSHPPCGDAAILDTSEEADAEEGAGRTGAKPVKRQRVDQASCCLDKEKEPEGGSELQQPDRPSFSTHVPQAHEVESYAAPQAVGLVRRKPGRGAPTLSVSCSDKLARWSLLGMQGALLGGLLAAPLHLNSLCVADSGDSAAAISTSLLRALHTRTLPLRARLPAIYASSPVLALGVVPVRTADLAELGLAAGGNRRGPCGSSIAWWAPPSVTWRLKPAKRSVWAVGPEDPASKTAEITEQPTLPPLQLPVLVGGTSETLAGLTGGRLGRARKGAAAVPVEAQSAVCRAALCRRFSEVNAVLGAPETRFAAGTTYRQAKGASGGGTYAAAWAALLEAPSPFEGWILKPESDSDFVVA